MLFAVPMALVLVIGAGVAIRAYTLSRREGAKLRWTVFLPAGLFLVGCAAVMAMINYNL
jgi:hypothetical protein